MAQLNYRQCELERHTRACFAHILTQWRHLKPIWWFSKKSQSRRDWICKNTWGTKSYRL